MPHLRPPLFGNGNAGLLFTGSAISMPTTFDPTLFGEVDLRAEFDRLVYGDDQNIRHGHLIVIRHLRRDAEGDPVPCVCIDEFSRDPDFDCSYCDAERYLWNEQWHLVYSNYLGTEGGLSARGRWLPPGEIRVDYKIFYLRFDTDIQYRDKLVVMKLDSEGNPVVPYVREAIHKPQTIIQNRSDNGRIEFITVYCREDDAIRSDTSA